MSTLIDQLVTKMGLYDESNVLSKTKELERLLDLRSANAPLQINEYAKIVLCADISAGLLGIAFDKEHALKLSGLRKSHYASQKRLIEKLLDLNQIMGVNDICIQLSLSEVSKKSAELLDLYKNIVAKENIDIDVTHPQYAAMAVFYACKLNKIKISKTKLMPFSNLRPTQWQQLEIRWDKFITKHYNNAMENKLIAQSSASEKSESQKVNPVEKAGGSKKTQVEDYENWKERMLKMAGYKLEQEEKTMKQMEKENFILGV